MADRATDPLTAVTAALTSEQRDAIVERFTALNPHWRGAEAADILDALADGDSDLDQTEGFLETHPELSVPGAGFAARALIWSGTRLDEASMNRLLDAAWLLAEHKPEGD